MSFKTVILSAIVCGYSIVLYVYSSEILVPHISAIHLNYSVPLYWFLSVAYVSVLAAIIFAIFSLLRARLVYPTVCFSMLFTILYSWNPLVGLTGVSMLALVLGLMRMATSKEQS